MPGPVGDVGTQVISPTVGMFAISSTKAATMRTHYKLAPLRLVERIVRHGGAIGRSGPISTAHVSNQQWESALGALGPINYGQHIWES